MLLFSVIAHEIAHGYAALKQGDRTALEPGRLTWNPVKHIDPFLTILLPLMMFTGSVAAGGRSMLRRREAGAGRSAQLSQHPRAATSSSRSPASRRISLIALGVRRC